MKKSSFLSKLIFPLAPLLVAISSGTTVPEFSAKNQDDKVVKLSDFKGKFVLPLGWKVIEKRPFVNGGIPVVAFVFERKSTSV